MGVWNRLRHFPSNSKFAKRSSLPTLKSQNSKKPNERFFTNLIKSHCKIGSLQEAVNTFYHIPKFNCTPSVVSLNCLLSFLCEKREGLFLVKDVLLKSQEMGIRLEGSTFRVLIHALCRNDKPRFAKEIMRLMGLFECEPDSEMYSLVLRSLCRESVCSSEIMGYLKELKNVGFLLDRLDFYCVIDLLVKGGKVDEAYCLVNEMRIYGLMPDLGIYNRILYGFYTVWKFEMVDEVFDEMLIVGLVPDSYTYWVYIDGMCKKGDLDGAVKMITCMERAGCAADVSTFNLVIGGYVNSGEVNKANGLMDEMVKKGVQWNSDTLNLYFDGLRKNDRILEAYRMFVEMVINRGFDLGCSGFNVLICGLCEKGFLGEAICVLIEMVERCRIPDAKSWESLLIGLNLNC